MAAVAAVAPAAEEEDSAVVAGCKVAADLAAAVAVRNAAAPVDSAVAAGCKAVAGLAAAAADLAVVARNAAAPVDSGAVVSEQAEPACNVVARADSARAGLLPAADLAAAFPPIAPQAESNVVARPWAPTATKAQLGVADLTADLLADWVFAQAPEPAARVDPPVGSGLVPASVQEGWEGPPVELEFAQVLAQEARADRPAE